MFPGALHTTRVYDERTREFVGDGTGALDVTGLLSLEAIEIDYMPFPLKTRRIVPKRDNGKKLEKAEVEFDTVSLDGDGTGRTMLYRAAISNDGIWQKGAKIRITGDWADFEAIRPPIDPETVKELESKDAEIAALKKELAAKDKAAKAEAKAANGAKPEAGAADGSKPTE